MCVSFCNQRDLVQKTHTQKKFADLSNKFIVSIWWREFHFFTFYVFVERNAFNAHWLRLFHYNKKKTQFISDFFSTSNYHYNCELFTYFLIRLCDCRESQFFFLLEFWKYRHCGPLGGTLFFTRTMSLMMWNNLFFAGAVVVVFAVEGSQLTKWRDKIHQEILYAATFTITATATAKNIE